MEQEIKRLNQALKVQNEYTQKLKEKIKEHKQKELNYQNKIEELYEKIQ
jgi:hypothetical protein